MTNPMGRSFLSYRRKRAEEAALLIAAQHDVGIPTWQDVKDLDEVPTADEVQRVLTDEQTANAILWLTPEVEGSDFIRKIEAPLILKRTRDDDTFFVIPVAAGGLDFKSAPAVLDSRFTLANLQSWNLRLAKGNPIDATEAAEIASRVLERRIEKIHRHLSPEAPLRLALYTREAASYDPETALTLDWSRRFHGFENRETEPGNWQTFFFPALRQVVTAISRLAPGRGVAVRGFASLSAVTALGAAFMATRVPSIAWEQIKRGGFQQSWSLDAPQEDSGFRAATRQGDVSATDLAVFVSIADNVEAAVFASGADLPSFRAITSVTNGDQTVHHVDSPGAARDIAERTVEEIRNARRICPESQCIHLFMAAPAGIALMIGQLANTLGPIQIYEHFSIDTVGRYRPAARLNSP
jgi:hypothetical protein